MPYFLHQEGDYDTLVIVEGETDAATAAGAGFSVLGVPGATNWKDAWWLLAEDFSQVVIFLDADEAAAHLLSRLAAAKPENLQLLVTAPALAQEGIHDLNDLHQANSGDFNKTRENIISLINRARPLKVVYDESELLEAVTDSLEGVSAVEDDDGDRKALCIFHSEKTPSLDFGPKGFKCFACERSGSLRTLGSVLGIALVQASHSDDVKYAVRNGQICSVKYTEDGIIYTPLCNFQARITEETLKDDGVEQTLYFQITGRLASGKPLQPLTVPADKFTAMNWVVAGWGAEANIEAGNGVKDKLRAAIQYLSASSVGNQGIPRKTVFTHLGWRKLNGNWVYLYTGGAVGLPNATVEPDQESLRRFSLPNEKESARLSLDLLSIGPPEVIIPLLAAVYRAPTCCLLYPTVTLWLYGDTGSFKSTLAALMSCHFGGPFTGESLPGSWISTENSLERALFLAHDVLYVIDDYAPERSARAAKELEHRVDRILRQVGNRTSRSRLRSDLSGRPEFIPNAMVVSTGEQLPLGVNSIAARILPVKCEKDKININALTEAQARQSELAKAMRGYIEWLAGRMSSLANSLGERFVELRAQALTGNYARLASSVAHLAIGWELFLTYALETNAITREERDRLWNQGWNALTSIATKHDALLTEERPTRKFLRTLSAMLTQGVVYLADRATGNPLVTNDFSVSSRMIGWQDSGGVYLIPDAAWREVNEYLRSTDRIAVTQNTLADMLFQEGLLTTDKGKKVKRIRVCGGRAYVWQLPPNVWEVVESEEDEDQAE